MKINLALKLFGAFFLILAIVVGAMSLSRYLFSLNFKNYIHQVEIERLQNMVPALREAYSVNGSWQGITADPQRWQDILRLSMDFRGLFPPPPPPDADAPSTRRPIHPAGPRVPSEGDRHRHGPPQVLLMDAQKRLVIGPQGPYDQRPLIPIEVDGRIVGWLGLQRHEPFKSGPPAALLARQTRQFYLLGAMVIALTALIAFMFSRHLLKPIHRLTRGARELADRNFTVRIQADTGDELGQLAENFNIMARTLENYEKMRRQWLTDISHELRTPLSVLRGEVEALQDGIREPTPQNLASLHSEILRLGKLVEDLHLLSTADSDKLYFNRQDMLPGRILESTLDGYRVRFLRNQIEIDLETDRISNAHITGDADRLEQVFSNLFENTIKYVQPPGVLKISGRVEEHDLVLCFEDSGPGVPDDALPRLFDRLYRVDPSRSRDTGGSGLGLSICRQIIENHGGRVWAQHSLMGGLSICIVLPMAPEEGQPARNANGG